MSVNVVAILDTLLEQARRERAEEIRLLSDLHPLFMSHGVSRSALGFELPATTVYALHSECLARSERLDLEFRSQAEYQFSAPGVGIFRCKYTSSSNVVSLSIYPDNTSPEMEAAIRPRKPPELRAEADPGDEH